MDKPAKSKALSQNNFVKVSIFYYLYIKKVPASLRQKVVTKV